MRKPEQAIREKIAGITDDYLYALDAPCATIVENAPLALIQLEVKSALNNLYWVLGEQRPRFKCDEQ